MNQKDLDKLVKILLKVKTKEEMENFLQGLLTPGEIVEFSTRIDIVSMLKKGIPQHEIAEKLGVGVATVTRGSNELKKGRFKYWQSSF